MTDPTIFESRYARVTCTAREFFEFVTDMRNFEQFIPANAVSNWDAEANSCSFSVSMLGKVIVRLSEKTEFTRVKFEGDAFKKEDFALTLEITDNNAQPADVKIIVAAELNPMMKMLAVKPLNQFLETLVNGMENFNGWKKARE